MSTNLEARAWVKVRADELRRNYTRVTEAVGAGVRVLPMVKANAYGLGVVEVVKCLEALDPWGFGVATVQEGVEIRRMGVQRPIVVCSPVPPGEIGPAVESGLELFVSSLGTLKRIEDEARAHSCVAAVHLDVDTGIGRSGFDWRTAGEWVPRISEPREHVRWVGYSTHLHSADEDEASISEQWGRLGTALADLQGRGELLVHVLNSAGIFRAPPFTTALVRPGIFLYGGEVGASNPSPDPVVSVHARVVHLREVEAGTTAGYGATYRAARSERWATLSIGYGDGLPRSLGNRGSVLLHGAFAPIIGRISMDVTVVNITDLPEVSLGDVATVLGSDGDGAITIDALAGLAGTISYEVLTGLAARLPRVWV
ncbi:MAG: alanine racemase [Gemmatimonadetes bacterium]|nr:alanine racemase [Gemmatimonadota bacterium]MDA1102832.1 alanine racemase [Gemmatimonadota bacterium]